MIKTLILILTLTVSALPHSQQANSPYYIDVLIDEDINVYFDENRVSMEEIAKTTRSKVNNLKFQVGKNIIYRVYADGKLDLGVIMDVGNLMLEGYSNPDLMVKRYLLETKEIPLDKNNWVDQLNKLDLKAIEN